MQKIIPIAGPSITNKEVEYVNDAMKNGWYENSNSYINRFEDAFKSYLGRKYAISLPSCTSALHLSLLSLGVGPGDEVIVPDATWIASVAPVSYVGACPIFADFDPDTWCISTKTVKPLITNKTKAIIAVNLYGQMPRYDELIALGIPIIEDSAESIGSKYKSKLSGTFGVTSCFSFHGSKTLTTGEGGILVTDDENIYQRSMILRDHGRKQKDIFFQNQEIGYKYKMSNIQAALGLAQIERINELVSKKREIFFNYKEQIGHSESFKLNPDCEDVYNSYWMTTIVGNKKAKLDKFRLMRRLKEKGIDSRPFFSPLSSLKAYENFSDKRRASLKNHCSYSISKFGVNLPSALSITKNDITYITEVLNMIFE